MLKLIQNEEDWGHVATESEANRRKCLSAVPTILVRSSSHENSKTEELQRELQSMVRDTLVTTSDTPQDDDHATTDESLASRTAQDDCEVAKFGEIYYDLGSIPMPQRSHMEKLFQKRINECLNTSLKLSASLGSAQAVICVAGIEGDAINMSSVMDIFANPPVGDPNLPYQIAIYSRTSSDLALLEVFPTAAPVLPRSEVRVGLSISTGWAKEVVGYTVCRPHYHQSLKVQSKVAPAWMTVSTSDNLDLLLFRKPRTLGFWFDAFHFNMTQFIDIFGGRYTRFTWLYD